jgi:hypothetical protein
MKSRGIVRQRMWKVWERSVLKGKAEGKACA